MSSCRHSARLVALFRFGEPGAFGDPPARELRHLEVCRQCQAQVAADRTLTRQVERALRLRVDGFAPSPAVWSTVRRRVVEAPPTLGMRLRSWLPLPSGGLTAMGAVSALAIALVVSGSPAAPAAERGVASTSSLPSSLPIRSAPHLEPALVPAEQLEAPVPPDVANAAIEVDYARPGKAPEELVVATLIVKDSGESVGVGQPGVTAMDSPPDGDDFADGGDDDSDELPVAVALVVGSPGSDPE